jgi:hypothetical protein
MIYISLQKDRNILSDVKFSELFPEGFVIRYNFLEQFVETGSMVVILQVTQFMDDHIVDDCRIEFYQLRFKCDLLLNCSCPICF